MKFLFLNSAGVWGGNEKWTYTAASSLSKNHQVFLAYSRDSIGERYTIPKYKLPFRFSYDPSTISRLVSIVKQNGIDILIPTKKRDYVIAGIVARLTGAKNILRLGIVRNLGRNPYKNFVYNKLTHGIIVNARPIKDVLLKSHFMREEKIRVIYNGVDIEDLDAKSSDGTKIEKPFPFLITTVGRVSKRKGIDELLKIFAAFIRRAKSEEIGLLIIGSGPRLDEYKRLCLHLGIAQRVYFTGFITNPYQYLKVSDVYITLSKNEGLSNALLEAMYFKNPVVTTKAGGVEDVIVDSQNGLLINENSDVEGVERLLALYKNKNHRISLGKKAKDTILEKFSIEKMTDEIVRFSKEIVERT